MVWTCVLDNCHHFPWSERVFIYHIIIAKKVCDFAGNYVINLYLAVLF